MANAAGDSAYAGYGAPSTAYGWYPEVPGGSESRTNRLTSSLWAAAAVFGLSSFAMSFASATALDSAPRFSLVAAIIAAVGLLRGQAGRGWIVVALAVTGLLDVVATWVRFGETDWVRTVVMALVALQSLVALGALVLESRALRTAHAVQARNLLDYNQFLTAYQAYAMQFQQPSEPHATPQVPAQGRGEGTTSAATTASPVFADEDALAVLQARYAQHGVGPAGRYPGPSAKTPAGPVTHSGMPGVDRSSPHSQPHPDRREGPGQASSF
jgi:Family of unknown function (DUF5336)